MSAFTLPKGWRRPPNDCDGPVLESDDGLYSIELTSAGRVSIADRDNDCAECPADALRAFLAILDGDKPAQEAAPAPDIEALLRAEVARVSSERTRARAARDRAQCEGERAEAALITLNNAIRHFGGAS